MWQMTNYRKIRATVQGKQFLSAKELFAYDCKNKISTLISSNLYSGALGQGEVVFSGTWKVEEYKWNPNAPGSVAELHWKIACK